MDITHSTSEESRILQLQNMQLESLTFAEHIQQGIVALSQIPLLQYQYNPRKLVFECDKLKLYHYQSKSKNLSKIPLLVVFATVNRPEILDLFPDRSFIHGLLEANENIYFLDWGYPDLGDKNISFNDYVLKYLHQCVNFIKETEQKQKIDLLGICQGGLICLCYTALSKLIRKLVLISTPVDFHTKENLVGQLLSRIDMAEYVRIYGNISGQWLTQFFISLRPFELVGKKYLRYVDNINNSELTNKFLTVEKWLYDAPDQPGKAFLEFVEWFYQKNKLIKGEINFDGHKIDLRQVNIPILNVMASQDEIVPPSASTPLKEYIKDCTEMFFNSGHIGIYISDKVGARMPHDIAKWLQG